MLIPVQTKRMFFSDASLDSSNYKSALFFAILSSGLTFSCIDFTVDKLSVCVLFIISVAALVILQLGLHFLFPMFCFSIPLSVWATVYAMVHTYSRTATPNIPQIFYRLVETISSIMMRMSNHIADSVKAQYSTTIKVANEISSQVECLMIRYTHIRIIDPLPVLS